MKKIPMISKAGSVGSAVAMSAIVLFSGSASALEGQLLSMTPEEILEASLTDNPFVEEENERSGIEPATEEGTPSLSEFLGKLFCDGCGNRCPLSHPQCGRARPRELISQATTQYRTLYGDMAHDNHIPVLVITKEATCTEAGSSYEKCDFCNKTMRVAQAIPPTGHKGTWITVTPATQDAAGEESRTCTVCGEVETKAIPKLAPDTPIRTIFGTDYEAKFWNWILFFLGFGWIWMWF